MSGFNDFKHRKMQHTTLWGILLHDHQVLSLIVGFGHVLPQSTLVFWDVASIWQGMICSNKPLFLGIVATCALLCSGCGQNIGLLGVVHPAV